MVIADGTIQLCQFSFGKKQFWEKVGANAWFWGAMFARVLHVISICLLWDPEQIILPRLLMSVANVLFLFRLILFGSGKEKALTPILLMTKTMSKMLISFVMFILICVVGFGVSLAALRHPSGFDRQHYTAATALNDIVVLPYWMIQGEMHEEFDPADSCNHIEYTFWQQSSESDLIGTMRSSNFFDFDPCVGPFLARFLVVLYMLLVGIMLVNLFVAMMTIEYQNQYEQQDIFYCTLMHHLVSDYHVIKWCPSVCSAGCKSGRKKVLKSGTDQLISDCWAVQAGDWFAGPRSQEEINYEKHQSQLRTTAKNYQRKYLESSNSSEQVASGKAGRVELMLETMIKKAEEDRAHSHQTVLGLQHKIEQLERLVAGAGSNASSGNGGTGSGGCSGGCSCSGGGSVGGSGSGSGSGSVDVHELSAQVERQHQAMMSLLSGSMMNLMMTVGQQEAQQGGQQEGVATQSVGVGEKHARPMQISSKSEPEKQATQKKMQHMNGKARQQVQTLMEAKTRTVKTQHPRREETKSYNGSADSGLQGRMRGVLHLEVPKGPPRSRSPSEPLSPPAPI
jgi:uncharacterized membrane protein YgcG